MPDLTVITAIAPHHETLFAEAAASVAAQTVPVVHLHLVDTDWRGPGAIRNQLLAQVETAYVTFLDADDWLEPRFAEMMLDASRRDPAHYVYSDWYQEGRPIQAPDCAWIQRTFHLVSAVVPTAWAREAGGFDESLDGIEDTDFYLKLVTSGRAGCRVPVPLVHYRRGGGRAELIHRTGDIERLQAEVARRYGGKQVSCCGGSAIPENNTPVGERLPGDVRAQALWRGNRTEMGRATGRRYPRTSYPHYVWVDPRDVKAAPSMWRIILEAPAPRDSETKPESLRGVAALAGKLVERGLLKEGGPEAAAPDPSAPAPIPNVRKVKRLAGLLPDLPVFVGPTKLYPSYEDFWRLVALGGFARRTVDQVDLADPRAAYIFVTPEEIPDCSQAAARTIFWQFEYAGDYTAQSNRETCREQWSSDPGHAARTGSRFVLLASHPGLNPSQRRAETPRYDIAMLAYLTPRRQAVKDRLAELAWAPDYPGHQGAARHEILSSSRLMLHVQQHDQAACAPIRYALAAAYHLPLIAEMVPDPGPYMHSILWAHYGGLADLARLYLRGGLAADWLADGLYRLLCVDHRFDQVVLAAVAEDSVRVTA